MTTDYRPDELPPDATGSLLEAIDDETLGAEDETLVPEISFRGDVDAEWAMRALVRATRRKIEKTLLLQAWAEKIEQWFAQVTATDDRIIARTNGKLERYAIAERERTRGERKTVVLPSGEIGTTKGTKPTVEIADEKAVLVWAADALDGDTYEVVAPSKPKVLVSELRKVVKIHEREVEGENGPEIERVVLDLDGNEVPGVTIVDPTTTAKVRPGA